MTKKEILIKALPKADLRNASLGGAKKIKSFQCGDRNRVTYAVKHKNNVMFKIGCFWGNTEKAIKAAKEKYGNESHYEKLITIYTDMLEKEI
jgi:hypothetical protein